MAITNYIPKAVSKYYNYDWQFAARIIDNPTIIRSSTVIAAMPILIEVYSIIYSSSLAVPLSLWATWLSSILYVLAWIHFKIRCPKFVSQYHDFGQYLAKKHSHRWILWELFNNVQTLKESEHIFEEIIDKNLAHISSHAVSPSVCRATPIFTVPKIETEKFKIYSPANLGRDLYIPVERDSKKFTITLQEDDPELLAKEKEFFWILLTPAARSRIIDRRIFWTLIYSSSFFLLVSIIWNASRVMAAL